jgi:hypothetical protein
MVDVGVGFVKVCLNCVLPCAHHKERGRYLLIVCKIVDISAIDFFIITNLIHKFLVHSHKLHKTKFIYMFRAQSAHHQEVNDVNCTYATPGIVTLCK